MIAYISFFYGDDRRNQNNLNDPLIGPFDDFNFRWYLVVGSALIFNTILQTITPYVGALLEFVKLAFLRFFDRGMSFDERKTRKVI